VRRAIQGTQYEVIGEFLKGPTAIALGTADQVKPVKILRDYLKKIKKDKDNEIRGGYLDGKALSEKEVAALAALPPIEELRGKLLSGIASPLNGLVASLNGPQRALVNVLDQYAKTKA
jgi:large subunit ribosomal protein L10